ncbi:MAG: hypothetical protein COU40_02060 [Candidatus Moranbacteria bacterium CG10_big_fil_rev_8_21_14_0_10_35_21]|nr:MAG: hypothetical protein COU40_02060 [Candidatus Moranbacteria bacterium CG10_big_fil_rev_8_21_14_0_10_35_21]PJA88598.1 MAG: hypothetical protein CO139_02300 [Candidatus Moranbacteria bacterium CG_4_9_14_3_um_filter_36_9]
MLEKIKVFWKKIQEQEKPIILVIAFILVSAISFEIGLLQGQKWDRSPLIIEKSAVAQNQAQRPATSASASEAQKSAPEAQIAPTSTSDCAFVGSKNSDKYHLPTCRWAKQIKPENIVCFKSGEDASIKGYQPDKNCIK